VLRQAIDDIEVVDVLLDDVIARQPVEVVPVIHLILGFRLLLIAIANPDAAPVPVRACQDDVADRTFLKLLDRLLVPRLVMPLQAHGNRQVLLLGDLVGCQHATHSRGIGRHRLFHENMLACIDCGFKMHRSEAGRGAKEDHVDTRVDDLLVPFDPNKPSLFRHIDAIVVLSLDRAIACLKSILEDIGHRRQLDRALGIERLNRSASTSATATDQSDLDFIGTTSEGGSLHRQCLGGHRGACGHQQGGVFQKGSTGRGRAAGIQSLLGHLSSILDGGSGNVGYRLPIQTIENTPDPLHATGLPR
jgi:hypothetical protein